MLWYTAMTATHETPSLRQSSFGDGRSGSFSVYSPATSDDSDQRDVSLLPQ